jgi:predicted permease
MWQDAVFAARLFRRQPGTVGLAIAGLALAIGVSTAVFSVLNAAAIRPLGVADPDATVQVWRTWPRGASMNWPYADYLQVREAARLSALEGWIRDAGSLGFTAAGVAAPGTPVHLVRGGYFSTFGLRTSLGRGLTPDDDRPATPLVAVVNHAFWRNRLGGDPDIVGRTVYFFGEPATIVGVADRTFTGPVVDVPAFWLPLAPAQAVWSYHGPFHPASEAQILVLARVMAGTPRQQAEAELSALAAQISTFRDGRVATGVSFASADNRGGPQTAIIMGVVMTAVGLVLLLACANIANLLLASAATREREIGVRLALGAAGGRIVRQLLTESVMVAAAGGAVGLVAVVWILPVVARFAQVPDTLDVTPDWRVYGFAMLAMLAAGLGSGLVPARYGTRGRLLAALAGDNAQAGARPRGQWVRSGLVGAQATASIVLLVLTALLTRAAVHVHRVDLGFDVERLAGVSVGFGRSNYDAARVAGYWDVALDRVRGLPGVTAAALAETVPLGDSFRPARWQRGDRTFEVYENRTSSEYLATVGISLVRGRGYSAEEVRFGEPVAVVSEGLARAVWGLNDPIGETLTEATGARSIVRIVGVAGDTTSVELARDTRHAIYRPLAGDDVAAGRLVVRTDGSVPGMVGPLRDAVSDIDPELTINVWALRDSLDRQLNQARSLAALAALVGGLALVLAVIGIVGVASFVVSRRMREVGVATVHALASVVTHHMMQVLEQRKPLDQTVADRDFDALKPAAFAPKSRNRRR